jgi:hypothetical protein
MIRFPFVVGAKDIHRSQFEIHQPAEQPQQVSPKYMHISSCLSPFVLCVKWCWYCCCGWKIDVWWKADDVNLGESVVRVERSWQAV